MRRSISTLLLCVGCFAGGERAVLRADEKPSQTIKQVMKEHKKGALKDKVLEGNASAAEKKQLVELYVELGKNQPPKGTEESWKKLTEALVKAAREISEGNDSGIDGLKKAVNCGTCHSAHKAN
jgi:D-tyrosyl-tRNA(Tyr) deacylase